MFPAVLLVVLCNVSNKNVNIFTLLSKSWSGNIGKEISPSTNCVSHKWKLILHLSWIQLSEYGVTSRNVSNDT